MLDCLMCLFTDCGMVSLYLRVAVVLYIFAYVIEYVLGKYARSTDGG